MATSTYLSNPVVTVNAVDLTDQCTAATYTKTLESLESTAFGNAARYYVAGLQANEITLTFYNSFAATETYATLSTLVGTQTTVTVKPTSSATGPTNPVFTLTNCYLESLPIVNASLGELDTIDITFTGGLYSVATA
jgi:hypothetical protein